MALVNHVQYDQFSPGKMVIRQTPVMVNDPLCAIENFKVTNHRYSVFQLDFWLNHKNGYIIESIHSLKTRNDEINYSLRHFQLFYNI